MTLEFTTGSGEILRVDESLAQETDGSGSLEILFAEAAASYNVALTAYRDGRIIMALEQAEKAISICPYSPRIVELGILLHAGHGLLDRASVLVDHLLILGEERSAELYRSVVNDRIVRWNEDLNNPRILADRVAQGTRKLGYREAVLIARRTPVSQDSVRTQIRMLGVTEFVAHAPNRVRRQWSRLSIAAAVVLIFVIAGLAFRYRPEPPGPKDSPPETAAQADSTELADAAVRFLSGALDFDDVIELSRLDTTDFQGRYRTLRTLAAQQTIARADSVWYLHHYGDVVRLLTPISEFSELLDPEHEYRLGLSAIMLGDSALADHALTAALDLSDASDYFRAEALYRLALISSPGRSSQYATELRSRYGSTIYDNTIIARILAPHE